MDVDNIFGMTEYVDVGSLTDEQSTNTESGEDTSSDTLTGNQEKPSAPDSDGQGESTGTKQEGTESGKTAEEPPKTEKILGKFNTEEDLKKAYNSLARKIEAELGQPYGSIKPVSENTVEDYQSLQSYYTQLRQAKTASQSTAQTATKQQEDQRKAEEAEYESRLIAWYEEEVKTNPLNANAVLNQYQIEKAMRIADEQSKQQSNIATNNDNRLRAIYEKNTDITDYSDAISQEIEAIASEEPDFVQAVENQPLILEKAYHRAKIKGLEAKVQELTAKLTTAFDNGKKASSDVNAQKGKLANEVGSVKGDSVDTSLPPGIVLINSNDMLL